MQITSILVGFFVILCIQAQLICDNGSLDTTCFVTGNQNCAQLQNFSISGVSLVVVGSIECPVIMVNLTHLLNITGNLFGENMNIVADFVSVTGAISVSLHTPNLQIAIYAGTVNISGNITAQLLQIQSKELYLSGVLSAKATGYPADTGPGAGGQGLAGGAYGGNPAVCNGFLDSSLAYGSITNPNNFGSGGASCQNFTGGAGGGVINIIAQIIIFVNGNINSDGGPGIACAGAGSGGTVNIQSHSMQGFGTITANGGVSGPSGLASGGRVAIVGSVVLSLTITAFGSYTTQNCAFGGAGTIFLAINNTLLLYNSAMSFHTGYTPVPQDYFNSIIAINTKIWSYQCGIHSGTVTLQRSTIDFWGFYGIEICILQASSIYIDSTSVIYRSTIIQADTLVIYGDILADVWGYMGALGPGAGGPEAGAGHGTNGSNCVNAKGGEEYDTRINPTLDGSGGGDLRLGGRGGGTIFIVATNFELYGTLSANGMRGGYNITGVGGGGSGGTININVLESCYIASSALVSAVGGKGGVSGLLTGGGGAGGRIFINASSLNISTLASITVTGGHSPCNKNEAIGTIVVTCITANKELTYCTLCGPGYYDNNFDCEYCPAGTYSNQVATTACLACNEGYYQNMTGMSECIQCNPGTYCNSSGCSNCNWCNPGYYSENYGALECTACPKGYYQNTSNSASCIYCSPGTYCNNVACISCDLCGPGYYSNDYISCKQCLVGTYSNQTTNTECLDCSKGYYQNMTGMPSCAQCTPGTYCDSAGCNDCALCRPGFYVHTYGATECIQCSAGTFCNTFACTTCSSCGPGYYSNDYITCQECSIGTFSNQMENAECLPCLVGQFQNKTGQRNCSNCGIGSYCNSTGCSNCTDCLAGYYTNLNGASFCVPCTEGTYQPSDGSSYCVACAVGTFQPNKGAISCLHCPTAAKRGQYECPTMSNHVLDDVYIAVAIGAFLLLVVVAALVYFFIKQKRTAYEAIGDQLEIPANNLVAPPSSGTQRAERVLKAVRDREARIRENRKRERQIEKQENRMREQAQQANNAKFNRDAAIDINAAVILNSDEGLWEQRRENLND